MSIPPSATACCVLFVELNRLGTSVIIATHDYALMEQLEAPRLVLFDGHLQAR